MTWRVGGGEGKLRGREGWRRRAAVEGRSDEEDRKVGRKTRYGKGETNEEQERVREERTIIVTERKEVEKSSKEKEKRGQEERNEAERRREG